MTDGGSQPQPEASRLQEALDTIRRAFDHPDTLTIRHTTVDDESETRFEVKADDETWTYRLRYDPRDDSAEPEIVLVE